MSCTVFIYLFIYLFIIYLQLTSKHNTMYTIKIAMFIISMLIDVNFQKNNLLKVIIPKYNLKSLGKQTRKGVT